MEIGLGDERLGELVGGVDEEATEQDGEGFGTCALRGLAYLPGVEEGTKFVGERVLGEGFSGGAGPTREAGEDEGDEGGEDVGRGIERWGCGWVRWFVGGLLEVMDEGIEGRVRVGLQVTDRAGLT